MRSTAGLKGISQSVRVWLFERGTNGSRSLLIAPIVTLPEQVDPPNAYRAMRAVLGAAHAERALFSCVYCPGLTTGVRGVPPAEAAGQMARAYQDFLHDA